MVRLREEGGSSVALADARDRRGRIAQLVRGPVGLPREREPRNPPTGEVGAAVGLRRRGLPLRGENWVFGVRHHDEATADGGDRGRGGEHTLHVWLPLGEQASHRVEKRQVAHLLRLLLRLARAVSRLARPARRLPRRQRFRRAASHLPHPFPRLAPPPPLGPRLLPHLRHRRVHPPTPQRPAPGLTSRRRRLRESETRDRF
mmetsp:Transcript_1062/g.3127  ORF Transcript_1062/g.3127 Transcript_1062/m.3127 type:complete len:202 (+) Transcript_1062:122-727(+)